MLTNEAVMAFLATTDAPKAKAFYGDVLGLRLISEDDFAIVFDCAGLPLRIQKVPEFQPHQFTSFGWRIADVAAGVAALRTRGVRFERYEFLQPDELNIWTAPGGAKVAWFKDPDGNLLSLSSL